jgi:hypothetical protein
MNERRRKSAKPRWLDDVAEPNYPAAESYLSLIYPPGKAAKLIAKLRAAAPEEFKAKDIFRASGLSLLGVSNTHVVRDCRKIAGGKALSPILLVRDTANGKVVVADGYHRMCAVYSIDEDAWIPCRIV